MASIITKPIPIRVKQSGFGIRKVSSISVCKVEVEFFDGLSIEEAINQISYLSKPQVILWYIGYRGFRESGIHFYRDFLISPLLECSEASFWLVDLTAWGAFKNPKCLISKESSYCDVIERFSENRIKCLRSAKILKKIQEIKDKRLIDWFRNALKRSFISELSKNFPESNILVKDIFYANCPILSDWYDQDASKAYSAFQYLEGCLLVDELFIDQISKKGQMSDIEIVFALPNDEIKYYKDLENSFQKDISLLISNRCSYLNINNINLKVKFLSFKYGSESKERPYNASGKVMNKTELTINDVLRVNRNSNQMVLCEAKSARK